MSRARKDILTENCLAHVTYKCHNGSFYFKETAVKEAIAGIIARYKAMYGIPIFEWIFMDSHPHLIVFIQDVDRFSNFMRQTNRAIAELVNSRLNQTGQVIQDRYRSPLIQNRVYCMNTVSYIWLNPVRAGMISIEKAHEYRYCSLFYRYRGLQDPISDSYSLLRELTGMDMTGGNSEQRFAADHLNSLISRELSDLCLEIFEHLHSIGTPEFVGGRRRIDKVKTSDPPETACAEAR